MKPFPARQIHLDFHTSPDIPGVGEEFNTEEFAQRLAASGVNSINLFAKGHHGMYYYPTRIGTVHPGLKKNLDLFGEQMKACRSKGIRACAYTTVVWNEDWANRHPEWLQINFQGIVGDKHPFDSSFSKWRALCCLNRNHADYIKEELKEIFTLYNPDGYWIDIIFQLNCICSHCIADMKRLGMDPSDLQDVNRHDRIVEIQFMEEIFGFIQNMDKDAEVYFNGNPSEFDLIDNRELSSARKREAMTCIDIESLPSEVWGYTHFPINVNYLNRYDQALTMMNGKFHKAWGDFGSLRNLAALQYECFRALAHGAGCCVGDQLHPSGKLDEAVYDRIGQVFNAIKAIEPWCFGTRKIVEIAVFASNRVLQDIDRSETCQRHTTNEGVYRILSELHYPFDFIDFETSLDNYHLLIIPDSVRLPEHIAEKINRYLQKGGKLLVTGKAGLNEEGEDFVIEDLGVEFCGSAEHIPRYVRVDETFKEIPSMDTVLYAEGSEIKAKEGTVILAWTCDSYFNRTWDRFCSHRQTPPVPHTSSPFMTSRENTIYIAHPLFRDYAENAMQSYKLFINFSLNSLLQNPLLKTDLPSTAELMLRSRNQDQILHLLHYIPQRRCQDLDIIEDVIPLYNQTIQIRREEPARKVILVPQKQEIPFTQTHQYISFTVPCINGHQMVLVE